MYSLQVRSVDTHTHTHIHEIHVLIFHLLFALFITHKKYNDDNIITSCKTMLCCRSIHCCMFPIISWMCFMYNTQKIKKIKIDNKLGAHDLRQIHVPTFSILIYSLQIRTGMCCTSFVSLSYRDFSFIYTDFLIYVTRSDHNKWKKKKLTRTYYSIFWFSMKWFHAECQTGTFLYKRLRDMTIFTSHFDKLFYFLCNANIYKYDDVKCCS